MATTKLPKDVIDVYPLSDVEAGMLYYTLTDSRLYHNQDIFQVKAAGFEPGRFDKALALMVEKHDILRTSFNMSDFDKPLQMVHKTIVPDIIHADISHLDRQAREKHIKKLMLQDRGRPFQVKTGSLLWRIRTFVLDEENLCLLWVAHHAIIDGWSSASLMTELNNTYYQLAQDPSYTPARLKSSYKDYILQEIVEKKKAANIDFWKKELAGYKKMTFPGPLPGKDRTGEPGLITVNLGGPLLEKLKETAAKYGTTAKNICFAAYLYMLNMFSHENDITAGIVSNNRPQVKDGDKIIGCFLNTVPVRMEIPAGGTWEDYMTAVEAKMKQVRRYGRIPLFEIATIIGEKTQGGNPIFDTLFNFVDFHIFGSVRQSENPGTKSEKLTLQGHGNANTLFDISISTTQGNFDVTLSSSAGGPDLRTVQQAAGYFKTILAAFAEEPCGSAGKENIISREEKQELLYGFNDNADAPAPPKTLHEIFEEQVRKYPGNIAVAVGPDAGNQPGRHLTYEALNTAAGRTAGLLMQKGAGTGSIVALMTETSVEMAIGLFGILKTGAAYLPLEPTAPRERLRYILENSGAALLLAGNAGKDDDGSAGQLDFEASRIIRLEDGLLQAGGAPEPLPPMVPMSADSPAYAVYTSGTTGKPKGVLVEHRGVVNYSSWRISTYRLMEQDVTLQLLSYAFDGFVSNFYSSLLSGGTLVLVPDNLKTDFQYINKTLKERGVTNISLVPGMYEALLENAGETDLQSLRFVVLAGEAASEALIKKSKAKNPGLSHIIEYGPTEATVTATAHLDIQPGDTTIIGKPIAGAAIYILDSNLSPLPTGVPGELVIGGTGVSRGYINQPDQTNAAFIKNPFPVKSQTQGHQGTLYRTGDMARWLPDGRIQFMGRKDFQVKIRGYRIELKEIEERLLHHPQVKETVVTAPGNEKGERYLCAYYVLAEASGTAKEGHFLPGEELRQYLTSQLPPYMLPSFFIPLDQIPLTRNGKIDESALPLPEKDGSISTVKEFQPPETEIEKKMAGIWAELLGVEKEKIGLHSSFFKLGGHSLKAAILVSRIQKEMNILLPISELFNTPTIKDISLKIAGLQKTAFVDIEKAPLQEYYALSYNQQRLWIIHRMEPGNVSFNMPGTIPLPGDVREERVKKALEGLLQRHESLRTGFVEKDGEPLQFIAENPPLPFKLLDLSAFEETVIEEKREAFFIEDARRPFDLSRPPLIRITLVKLGDEKWELIFNMHHIISDGWSIEILKHDFARLYENTANKPPVELGPLELQYKDFAYHQRLQMEQGEYKTNASIYWKDRAKDGFPTLELPTDFKPDTRDGEAASYRFSLDNEIKESLKAMAAASNTSLFMVLYAAYYILSARISGQKDVVCAIVSAGRDHISMQHIVGFFINSVMVKLRVDPGTAFEDFLAEVNRDVLEALRYGSFPIEQVLEELGVPYPEVSTAFNMLNMQEDTLEIEKGSVGARHVDAAGTVKYDIALFATEYKDGIEIGFDYRKTLFKPSTIQLIADGFQQLLTDISGLSPKKEKINTRNLGDLRLFDFDRLKSIGNTVAPTNEFLEFPREDIEQSLPCRFEAQVRAYPDRIAVKMEDIRLTYDGLNRRANRLARVINREYEKNRRFVEPVDSGHTPQYPPGSGQDLHTVALLFGQSVETIVGIFGVLKAGKTYVPLDSNYPRERLEYMLKDSGSRLIVTDKTHWELASGLRDTVNRNISLIDIADTEEGIPDDNLRVPIAPGTLAYILYTSGSTGIPKGVIQNHRNALHFARVYTNALHINRDDRLTLFSSYSFDAAKMDIYGALLNGARLYPYDIKKKDGLSRLPSWLQEEKISIFHSIPTVYRYFTDQLTGKEAFPFMRFVVMGGEAVFRKDIEIYQRAFPAQCLFINGLGPTESTVTLQYYIDKQYRSGKNAVPVGYAVDETTVYLLKSDDTEAGVFEVGEIVYKSDFLALGYLNKEQKTREMFRTDPVTGTGRVYCSGDLGRRLPDGCIEYAGRKDFQVKVRGYRIELGEVEGRLDKLDGIKKSVVVCRKDANGENYLAAYYTRTGEAEVVEAHLVTMLKNTLPEYMIPNTFLYMDEFPLTSTGKIDRKALAEDSVFETVSEVEYAVPGNTCEMQLTELWRDLLAAPKIGIDDNFFVLGGNSLKAIILASRVHKLLNVKVPLQEVFKNPTIRGLARYISSAETNPYQAVLPAPPMDYYPLSAAQQRLYIVQQLDRKSTGYNMPSVVDLDFQVDVERLETTFKKLIRRHESLRTSFHMLDEEPVQKIEETVPFNIEQFDIDTAAEGLQSLIRPFDLSRAPLLRAGLVKNRENHSVLLVDIHHIVSDANSNSIMVKEFSALYHGAELPELRLQYKDYALWQNSEEQTARIARQETYWLKEFEQSPPIMNLPVDFDRSPVFNPAGDTFTFSVGPMETQRLKELAAEKNATLFMVTLAVYNIFLSKITGQEDILVGTPLAGRGHPDLEPIIGMFINTLVLKNYPRGEKDFDHLVKDVKNRTLEAFENQDYPFEKLVDRLDIKRIPGRNPLFDVLFTFQHLERSHGAGNPEVPTERENNQNSLKPVQFDLILSGLELKDRLTFRLEYRTSLFKRETIERYAQYFQQVLENVLEDSTAPLSNITVTTGLSTTETNIPDMEFGF